MQLFAKQKLIRRVIVTSNLVLWGNSSLGIPERPEDPLVKSILILGSCLISESGSLVHEVLVSHFILFSFESQSVQCCS